MNLTLMIQELQERLCRNATAPFVHNKGPMWVERRRACVRRATGGAKAWSAHTHCVMLTVRASRVAVPALFETSIFCAHRSIRNI